MNYKLVAIDMDGTLLNSNNEVSKRTISAIEKATKEGVHIVLATGRILKSAEQYADMMNLNNYILACNGAIIVDDKKKTVYDRPMDLNIVKDVMSLGRELDIYYHFYDKNNFYSNIYIREIVNYYNANSFSGQPININIFNDDKEIYENKDMNIYKFLFIDNEREKLVKLRQELSTLNGINISSSWDNNLEVMDNWVSKGNSLEFLCNKLKISAKDVIAIGDNENDLTMINYAGLGVSMGNAADIVKNNADIITTTNDEDGVAKIIEKYVLGTGDEI